MTEETSTGTGEWRFDDLRALYLNCTLQHSPEPSHTQGLIDVSVAIMERHGVTVEQLRAVDHDIATGVWPDMTEHGRVAGCLLTGNEDGVEHGAMNFLDSLQRLGYTIPPQADAGWIGEAGPAPPTSTPARAAPRTTSPTATPPSRPGT